MWTLDIIISHVKKKLKYKSNKQKLSEFTKFNFEDTRLRKSNVKTT